jgi:hypothetical protein
VHTLEFGFKRGIDNVITATRRFGVDYPITPDNDYTF